jgi:hypothetical protein
MFTAIVHATFAHLIVAYLLIAGCLCFCACVNLREK